MRYIDTNVLLAYLVAEPGSKVAEGLLRSQGSPIAISSWTETEMLSALGIKIRSRQITPSHGEQIVDQYSHSIAHIFVRLPVQDKEHRMATLLLNGWTTTLRAGDALHLAIAATHGATVYTFDRAMAKAALQLGVEAKLLTS